MTTRTTHTVKNVGIGGATATMVIWIVGFYQPELMSALPVGGEAAMATIFAAIYAGIREAFYD